MRITLNKWPLLRTASAALLAATASLLQACGGQQEKSIVYSGRHYNTDKVYERFTEKPASASSCGQGRCPNQ